VVLDRAVLRNGHELLRRELQDERHDADIGVRILHRLNGLGRAQRLELMHLQAFFLGGGPQRIRAGAFLLRRAKHRGDGVPACEKRFQHGFAEILLTDDRDLHDLTPLSVVAHAGFFLGGIENAPAALSLPMSSSP
jgi:hypothetical protein